MNWNIMHIGAPITLSLISIITYIFVGLEIKKKRIEIKDITIWFVVNSLYTASIIYIFIVEVVQYSTNKEVFNIFSWIAINAFGIKFNGQEWLLILIFAMISFILIQVMVTTLRTQKLKKRIDDLNKEVAILSGKVNKTANINITKVADIKKTSIEVKRELKEQIKIAKSQKKANEKLKIISKTKK